MNLELEGSPIALLETEPKQKKNQILSVGKADNNIEEYKCNPKETIQQLPDVSKERTILYVTGASGSGKSYYIKNFADQYRKLYPKRPIYVFSALADDTGSLDKIKKLQRVKIHDPAFLAEEITTDQFAESFCIFDDCEAIANKPLRKKVWEIQNGILTTGRHHQISCAVATHTATNGNETKLILNEAHSVTIFPTGLGGRSLKYLLEGYFGLDKNQIKRLKKLDSRWVTVVKGYPMTVLSEKEAYVLRNTDD